MRELKFRAWYKPDKDTPDGALIFEQIIFDDQMYFAHGMEHDVDRLVMYPFEVPFMDKNWIVEQYTGLKDKNGKEIYEGDIIQDVWKEYNPYGYNPDKCDEITLKYKVKYSAPKFVFDNPQSCEQQVIEDWSREIIGNIHENPDLLKE